MQDILNKKVLDLGRTGAYVGINEYLPYLKYALSEGITSDTIIFVISSIWLYDCYVNFATNSFEDEPFKIKFFLQYLTYPYAQNKIQRLYFYMRSKLKTKWLKTKPVTKLYDTRKLDHKITQQELNKHFKKIFKHGRDTTQFIHNTMVVRKFVEYAQSKGIKVFMIDEDANNNFDGLAAQVNSYHIIVISKNWPGDRQRFTLAHELVHLMLEGKLADTIDEEKASDRFAGAFLLPEDALKERLGDKRKSLEIAELSLIKQEFGVIMQTVFIRANHAKIIDYHYSNKLWKFFKKEGWNIKEPGEQYPSEKVHYFKQLILRAVSEEYIEEAKAAELLDMTVNRFHKFRMTGK
jgi:Zn-dependent peptidase ImmA (M78 family)